MQLINLTPEEKTNLFNEMKKFSSLDTYNLENMTDLNLINKIGKCICMLTDNVSVNCNYNEIVYNYLINDDDIQTLILHKLNLAIRKNKSKYLDIFDEEVNLFGEDIIFREILNYYHKVYKTSGLLSKHILHVFYNNYSDYVNIASEIYISLRDKNLV